jgi:hypothetical protein
MKTTSLTLLTTAMLSISSFVSADAAPECEVEIKKTESTNDNRFYAAPEFMWSHFHGPVETDSFDFSLNQNVYYGGLRFGHEYLKPQAFYSNTDIVALLGTTHSTAQNNETNTKLWDRTRETFKGERGHLWTNAEQRFGYTFASSLAPSCTVSVYGAPGFHYEHVNGKHAYWYYAATGLKTVQQFSDSFHLGCDLKVMYAFGAQDKDNMVLPTTLGKKEFWGYEVGVPFEWKLGKEKEFDIQLKPYLLKLNMNSQETILGTRLELGYNF